MTPSIHTSDPSLLFNNTADTLTNTTTISSREKIMYHTIPVADDPSNKNLFDQTYEERWTDASFQKVATAWKLTQEEQDQLRLLQASLKDVISWKNNPLDIVRYLRGPGKFDSVEPKFRDMIAWREQKQADRLLEDYRPPKALLWYVPSAILEKYDKDGDPIYLERGGVMDGVGLQQHFSLEEIIQHVVWLREIGTRGDWLQDFEAKTGRTPTQVTIIYDMQGMSSRHMKGSVMTMFKEIVAMNQTRYCGLAKRIMLLRAPSIFQFIWNIAKHFFPPEGRKLMVFTSASNYMQELDKYVDREVLPPCICKEGKGKAMDSMPQNYAGGLIPKKIEGTIPENVDWMEALANGSACPRGQRQKQQLLQENDIDNTSTNREFKSSAPASSSGVTSDPPVCLSEVNNVKVMNSPQAEQQNEFEAVFVKSG